jgi:hypothetical protein
MKIKQILIDTNTGEDVHHRSLGSLHLSWSQLSTALNTAVKSGSNIGVQWWRNWGRGPPDLIPSTAPASTHTRRWLWADRRPWCPQCWWGSARTTAGADTRRP